LIAEAREIERATLEAMKHRKHVARIDYTVTNLPTPKDWAAATVIGPNGLNQFGAPVRDVERAVEFMNAAHEHVDVIFQALLANDKKLAWQHVAKLFRSARRAVGRPKRSGKANAMRRVLAWLAQCPAPPPTGKVKQALERAMQQSGKCPARSTLYAWAKEALEEDASRRRSGR
jgi:hypothetical protein